MTMAARRATTACSSKRLVMDPERPTGTCVVMVTHKGDRTMMSDPGANAALSPDDLPKDLFSPGTHLHVSGYTLLNPGANYVHQAYQNNGPVNRNLDVGPCDQDRRQIFNTTAVFQTPGFSNKTLNAVAAGWSFSTIFSARSGRPLNILLGNDQALNGFQGNAGTQRPNQILASQ